MNKSAIKNFAVNARKKLIQDVAQKAYNIGIDEKDIQPSENFSDGYKIDVNGQAVYINNMENEQREKLISQINEKGYEQVIEEVAYTWFNRIIAIRFMEVNDYLPSGIRILSSEDKTKVEPDAIREVRTLIDEIGLDTDAVYKYQDENDTDGLFKYIFKTQCNELNKIMPVMFDKINDYTELLLPDKLLAENSVVRSLVNDIDEEDFKDQVEIIGWMYQYYISEKKDQVFADLKKNKKITKENIPAATQLFTPDWIVKYMVENSLGRLWLEGHPDEELKSTWKYYLEEAKQELEVQAELEKIREESKNLRPEDITVLDPSMGSGHILVYAFDVLYQIYESAGYSEREIPRMILENNLYGLDIDDRAGQLAYFALMMTARSKYRRFFRDIERNPIELNVCSIQESNGLTKEDIEYFSNGDEKLKKDLEYLVEVFTDAKEYGSILEVKEVDFEGLENRLVDIKEENVNLLINDNRLNVLNKLPNIIKQGKIISKNYEVSITNPPYMGIKGMNIKLSDYVKKNYPNSKSDLCTVFIERTIKFTKYNKYISLITMHSWMFLSSFEKLREVLINNNNINSLNHLGTRAFEEIGGEVVQTVSWVMRKESISKFGNYIRLVDYNNSDLKENEYFNNKNRYSFNQEKFKNISGSPVAYWASNKVINIFKTNKKLKSYAEPRQGLATADNNRFLRLWYEVGTYTIGLGFNSRKLAKESNFKWFPYNKGGDYRKWYGNSEYLVNWYDDGVEIRNFKDDKGKIKSRPQNMQYYFKEGITWSKVTAGGFSTRYVPKGHLFDVAGCTVFPNNTDEIYYYLGLLNSNVSKNILSILSPTVNYEVGHIASIPIVIRNDDMLRDYVNHCINISKKDWDSFETSWDFKKHPMIEFKSNNIENSFNLWSGFTEKQFNQLKSNEEELNKIFIDIYGLQDELTPEVEDKDITIRKADRDREIKSFISYAVGCMLGRYSLDVEGLAYAGGEFDESKYKAFKIDSDGIIPITDKEYFEDDIVTKFVEFVKVVFGEETLEDNLEYIADTECFKRKKGETARNTLRRYFLKGFIEEHIKIYQKRPIYWMFDSGKQNGFRALIYMHRYNEGTVAKVRTDYLHELQRKYEQEISSLDMIVNSDVYSAKEKASAKKEKERVQKQIAECVDYDRVVAHAANQKISIDLDDGVKVNYGKFSDVLFKIKM